MLTTIVSTAVQRQTATPSAPDHAFIAALLDARLHALTVLRSILDLATLPPEARAAILSDTTGLLALLRESRLAAAQILQLQFPLPEGGRAVGSSLQHAPRATGSPRDNHEPPQLPHTTNPPVTHPDATRQPLRAARDQPTTPPATTPLTTVDHPTPTPLTRRAPPTQTTRLLSRAGAAP